MTTLRKGYTEEDYLKAYNLHLDGNGGLTVGYDLANEDDKFDFTMDFQFENLGDDLINIGRTLKK